MFDCSHNTIFNYPEQFLNNTFLFVYNYLFAHSYMILSITI